MRMFAVNGAFVRTVVQGSKIKGSGSHLQYTFALESKAEPLKVGTGALHKL
jgi:hypothetical protein